MLRITRRTLLKFLSLPFVSALLSCSRSTAIQSLDKASKEKEFTYFLDVIFPAKILGLSVYHNALIQKLIHLEENQQQKISKCYSIFKKKYLKNYDSFESYELLLGESVISEMLININPFKHADETNEVLDIIYAEISTLRGLQQDLWHRKCSVAYKMCVYWDTYDEPVQS